MHRSFSHTKQELGQSQLGLCLGGGGVGSVGGAGTACNPYGPSRTLPLAPTAIVVLMLLTAGAGIGGGASGGVLLSLLDAGGGLLDAGGGGGLRGLLGGLLLLDPGGGSGGTGSGGDDFEAPRAFSKLRSKTLSRGTMLLLERFVNS
jgi:hypothetical protein